MSERPNSRRIWILASLLLALVVALVALKLRQRPVTQGPAPTAPVAEPSPAWEPVRKPARRRPASRPVAAPVRCTPGAYQRCERGDVWSFDSCGVPEQKTEECGPRLCELDSCRAPGSVCDAPPEGRCDGDVVELCYVGELLRIDCAAQDMVCAQGGEGAECAPRIPEEERCSGEARCEGDVLVRCVEGRRAEVHCGLGRCAALPGGVEAACITTRSVVVARSQPCGPCGCGPNPSLQEAQCDGRDEDGDGRIDDGLACAAVPVIAFRITNERDEASHSELDIRAELDEVNRIFANDEQPGALQFELSQVVDLAEPDLLKLQEEQLVALADAPAVHPAHDGFYVPVLFVDDLLARGGVPKPGMSTLPNATCGGVQQGRGPEQGLVAVAKARYPTTLAHELGHFFGLCHTHDQVRPPLLAAYDQGQGVGLCEPVCKGAGDGICDTPTDPGPESCGYDPSCQVACASGAEPEASNLMSYYAECRDRFSPEQMALMQHTLALRRGWDPCRGGACTCEVGEFAPALLPRGDTQRCPVGMSCRPIPGGGASGRCRLDGPRPIGATCESADDCRDGALCVQRQGADAARCTRPCVEDAFDCNCSATQDGFRVCMQDMGS